MSHDSQSCLDEEDAADMLFTSNVEQSIHNSDNETVPEAQSTHGSDNESQSHHGSQLHSSGELLSTTKKHHDLQEITLNISRLSHFMLVCTIHHFVDV